METQYNKISETELEVTKSTPIVEPTVTKYERSFIENQIIQIQKSKDEFDALRDTEIKECKNILVAMDAVGIISNPIEIKNEDNLFIEEVIS